ncbi:YfiR family protein [Endozoicomonadaceae bacterium StTr2]
MLTKSRTTHSVIHLATAIALVLIFAFLTFRAEAATAISKEEKIKAAMVYKITQSVTWPQRISNLSVCLMGDENINLALKKMDGKLTEGRRISVTHKKTSAPLHRLCDMLYIPHASKLDLNAIMQRIGNNPLLTIGDSEQFLTQGGMIALIRTGSKVTITINRKAVEQANLKLGSALLGVARTIN